MGIAEVLRKVSGHAKQLYSVADRVWKSQNGQVIKNYMKNVAANSVKEAIPELMSMAARGQVNQANIKGLGKTVLLKNAIGSASATARQRLQLPTAIQDKIPQELLRAGKRVVEDGFTGMMTQVMAGNLNRHNWKEHVKQVGKQVIQNVVLAEGAELAKKGVGLSGKTLGEAYRHVLNKTLNCTLKEGEYHQVLLVNGKAVCATYSGPGTDLEKKIRTGARPLTQTDKIAMEHDLHYALAKNKADVRQADKIMMARLDHAQRFKTDHPINTTLAKTMIGAKMSLEDLGLPGDWFADAGGSTPEQAALYTQKLAALHTNWAVPPV
jgi:hypothetical protein